MTGSARGSASATEPLGRPGPGWRGSRTLASGGGRHGRRRWPPARSISHLAGAVRAIHSGLVTTSIKKRRTRPARRRVGRAAGLART